MATSDTTSQSKLPLPVSAQQKVIKFLDNALANYTASFNIREQLRQRDLAYLRTEDMTEAHFRAKSANKAGDSTKLQNITVPVVMPQVESALSYHVGVFLTGYPIFGVVAPPTEIEAQQQFEALIIDQSIRAGWVPELVSCLRDGLKYDLGAVEVCWDSKRIFNLGTATVENIMVGKPKEAYYSANYIKRIDPYNLILDTRVSPSKNHIEGEFAGYTQMLSRIATKQLMESLDPLYTMNYRAALESGTTNSSAMTDATAPFYTPQLNPDALLPASVRQAHDWSVWWNQSESSETRINYRGSYEVTTLYCRILPSDLGISTPDKNHVSIWKFVIINRSVVIFAQKLTNAHNYLPILVCKPNEDGLGWQGRSFAENVIAIQQLSSALVNSAIESQRRKVYDRLLYDPTRVNKKDIDNVSSVARIPVKSTMYSKNLAEAVYQIPYRDDGIGEILQLSQQIVEMGNIINGTNRVQQGQFQKGNKTRREFDTVMSNSNARQQTQALMLEYTFFTPLKEIIKSNILQYQPASIILSPERDSTLEVNPETLRSAHLTFTLSDGLLPSEKIGSIGLLEQFLQLGFQVPDIRAEYDLSGMITYYYSLMGARWLKDFKRSPEQIQAYLQQMAAAASASNPNQPLATTKGEPA